MEREKTEEGRFPNPAPFPLDHFMLIQFLLSISSCSLFTGKQEFCASTLRDYWALRVYQSKRDLSTCTV